MPRTDDPQALPPQLDQEGLLHRITNQIRQSLDLSEILRATVAEVRALLETDRVMVYRFHTDTTGEVIAESIYDNRLPSLLGLNFPADDIPLHAREIFLKKGGRSIVNVASGLIGLSLPNSQTTFPHPEEIYYRSVDPCHIEYLKAMGVQSSLVVPILHRDDHLRNAKASLWGLLVSHHSESRTVSDRELQIVQLVADQVSVAIAQSNLLRQAHEKAAREATINRVATLLHALPKIQLQEALEETVAAFQCSGGRIYIAAENFYPGKLYQDTTGKNQDFLQNLPSTSLIACGTQPTIEADKERLIEEHPVWQAYFELDNAVGNGLWVVTDLYKEAQLRVIAPAFSSTQIRGMLIVPLQYRQKFLGYLSVFRDGIDTETLWAGQFNPDLRQLQPRNSFEAWRELKRGQAQEWTHEELELAHALSYQFSMAIQQYQLYEQVQALNANLERQVQERTAQLQKSLKKARVLQQVTGQIRSTLELQTILQTIVQEVRVLLSTDRVVIYKFTQAWEGEVVVEEVTSNSLSILEQKYEDECFSQEYAYLYKIGRLRAIDNVFESNLQACHIDFLRSIQVQASLTVPIRMGEQLWGLLIAHECHNPRIWQTSELDLLQQLADQAAIAIHQAELYEQSRTAEAEANLKARKLEQVAEQQQALFRVITKIRESLNIQTILKATTTEVQHLLGADRVGVFRFHEDGEVAGGCSYERGEFISEDIRPGLVSALAAKVHDHCFGKQFAAKYHQGRIQAVADIYDTNLSHCHIQLLEQFQVRANLVVPLLKGDVLWGLLCIHQCDAPRHWEDAEIDFVTQIAAQLGVALQQAELLAQTQRYCEQLSCTLDQLKKTQTQLIQTEKMSSLGQLVAGVAHEINNPVNFIYGNLGHAGQYAQDLLNLLDLYQQHYPHPDPEIVEQAEAIDLKFLAEDLPKLLISMKVGAERIYQLVVSLRNFSRLDQADRKPVDIHEGLDSTLLILQHRLKAKPNEPGIQVIKTYSDLPLVECHAGQLNQVFMNVISNAIDALEQRDDECPAWEIQNSPSQITIRTSLRTESLVEGLGTQYVVIQIADNGLGMTDAVQSQIFDPFFTTKPVGKGTGLGLSISYQIVVEKHGGMFKCLSVPGQGTEFRIEIPVQQD